MLTPYLHKTGISPFLNEDGRSAGDGSTGLGSFTVGLECKMTDIHPVTCPVYRMYQSASRLEAWGESVHCQEKCTVAFYPTVSGVNVL